jgi:hypothetical protein
MEYGERNKNNADRLETARGAIHTYMYTYKTNRHSENFFHITCCGLLLISNGFHRLRQKSRQSHYIRFEIIIGVATTKNSINSRPAHSCIGGLTPSNERTRECQHHHTHLSSKKAPGRRRADKANTQSINPCRDVNSQPSE